MTAFLNRLDSVPIFGNDFTSEFNQWLANITDTLNEALANIESVIFYREAVGSTPFTAIVNSAYIVSNAALTTITLPDSAAVGAVVKLIGSGAGGWVLKPGSGQTIKVNSSSAGTSIASTNRYDCISIICIEANTTWVTTSSQTSGFTIT